MWYKTSINDTSKGEDKSYAKGESLYFPFPCSDTTDCTNYVATLAPGEYMLEVWGSQGGNDTTYPETCFGGRGGYSKGTIKLSSKTTLYIYVGGAGT